MPLAHSKKMSSSDIVIAATKFNPTTDITYAKPKVNKSGGKAVSIFNARTKKALYISTPLMLTYGVNEFRDEKTGKVSYDLSLQFPREDYMTDDSKKFLDSMIAFQNKIRADAITNSKDWLNKPKMTEEVVDALFHPMLKYPKNPNTGEPDMTKQPTLKIKLNYYDDKFNNCEIYGANNQMLFPDESSGVMPGDIIGKNSIIAVVMICGGLWFANGKFGVTWKLFQAAVQPKSSNLKGRCLIPFTDDSAAASAPAPTQQVSQSSVQPMEIAQDSDAEDDEESQDLQSARDEHMQATTETPQPTPTPVPVVTENSAEPPAKVIKKVIRKVKA